MQARLLLVAIVALALAACGSANLRGDGPPSSGSTRIRDLPGDAVPRPEAQSKYGNGPVYEVFGKRYRVMPSSKGYQERGVASWYGRKFHGNLTSNREVYDMHAMTAAHKTLPLPTYVRVRNLQNDKSIIVRVNDRGPFIHNRIIDLSYAAAARLDMLRDGTSLVEVTAIDFDTSAGDRPTRNTIAPAPVAEASVLPSVETSPDTLPASPAKSARFFLQVGAFGDRSNAERRLELLAASGIDNAFIHEDSASTPPLLRVRIGPVAEVIEYDILVEELENIGIMDPYLVVD